MILASLLAAIVIAAAPDSLAPAGDSLSARPPAAGISNLPDTAGIIRLKEVVITATRTPIALLTAPASVSVIVPDALTPSQSVQSSLAQIAGASFGATGGQGSAASVFLRGASSENVLVLLDGVPLNSPLLGGYDLNKISGNADRIEVVRGPASSLYGANAVGGVINITTAPAPGNRPFSLITYLKGSYGTQQLAAKFSRALAAKLSMWMGADWNSTGGQRINSSYDGTNYSVGVTSGPFYGISAAARFQDYAAEAGVPGPLWHETPYAKQRDKQQDIALHLSRNADSGTCLAGGSLAIGRSTVRNAFENDGVVTDNDSRTLSVDGQYSFGLPAAVTLTAGGSYQRTECESDNSGDHGVRQRALFANALFRPIDELLLVAGARYDRNFLYPAQYSPSISASYQLALPDGWSLAPYASWGRAYRAPTVNELFWRDDLWMMYGSDSLLPERSWQVEAGTKAEGRWITIAGSLFRRSTTDMIQWQFMPDWSMRTVNFGRVDATGVEVSFLLQPLSWLRAELNYTHCITARNDNMHDVLPYRPIDIANASMAIDDLQLAQHLMLGWKLSARCSDSQKTGSLMIDDALPWFLVCDQTLSLKISDARIYYRVDNLFNANYQTRYGYPMPRRSYAFGIALELWD